MRKTYTVLREFIETTSFLLIMYIVLVYGFGAFPKIKESPVLTGAIYLYMSIVWFRDYKIVTDDYGIELHSIFRKNKFYQWKDIKSIEFAKQTYGKIEVGALIMNILIQNSEYRYSVERFEKKIILNELINRCCWNHIEIKNFVKKEYD